MDEEQYETLLKEIRSKPSALEFMFLVYFTVFWVKPLATYLVELFK